MNAATIATGSRAADAPENLQQFTRDSTERWSRICQDFFDLERREMLERQPTAEDLETHRTVVKWLIRATRAMLFVAGDPDYPDHSMVRELEGRLVQLQHSWRQFQEPLPEADADKILNEVFPE